MLTGVGSRGWGGNCQYGIRGIRGVGGGVTLGSIHGSDLSSSKFIPLPITPTIHPSTTIPLFAKYVHLFFGHYQFFWGFKYLLPNHIRTE